MQQTKDGYSLPTETRKPPQGRLQLWWKRLIGPTQGVSRRFSSWRGALNEPNQRVIRADCERTKADMEYFRQANVRDKMEAMLTCWCQTQNTKYKQGLNEVLAPFLNLQVPLSGETDEGRTPAKDDEVFDLFAAFVQHYAPFFFCEEFVPLQCAFIFFRRLLLYHCPQLQNFFAEKGVTPDMFCMPWFLTLFASKTPMRLTVQLWDRLLERGEQHFFMFLALAVVIKAEQTILQAERSALPEILTSLGVFSVKEMESLWSFAEELVMQTPATFMSRVRRIVLHPEEKELPQLERLEKEGVFFIFPEEVVGHCYPPRPGEALKPWQPPPSCTWRLLLLDLRPAAEFEAMRLPAAVHFDAAARFPQSSWSGRKAALFTKGSSAPESSEVLDALKETLGENWLGDDQAHICLVGRSEESWLLRAMYTVLTSELSLRHISVASGGFEAVLKFAQKYSYDIVQQERWSPVGAFDSVLRPRAGPSAASLAAESAAVAAAAAEGAAKKLSSGLSLLANLSAKREEGKTEKATTPAAAIPKLIDRPGNWSPEADMSQLPKLFQKDLQSAFWHYNDCIALIVRPPNAMCPELTNRGLQGCKSVLAIQHGQLLCAKVLGEELSLLAKFDVHQVAKVTSKKTMPQTAHFHIDKDPSAEPWMVLYFSGAEKVKSFVFALQAARKARPPAKPPQKPGPLGVPAFAQEVVAQRLSSEGPMLQEQAAEQPKDGALPDSPKAHEQQADGQAERPQDGAVPDSPKANEQQEQGERPKDEAVPDSSKADQPKVPGKDAEDILDG